MSKSVRREMMQAVGFGSIAAVFVLSLVLLCCASRASADGKAYTIKWTAADPAYNKGPYAPTYQKVAPPVTIPTGRASDPMANAIFGSPEDAVSSLAPADLALGQIVPFEAKITVGGSTAPENGTIVFTPSFDTYTSSNKDFGFDPAFGIYAAFVDYGDAAQVDPGNDATVSDINWFLVDEGTDDEQIQGEIRVTGLDDDDIVIVEIWVVLKSTIPADANGTVQTGIVSAETYATEPDKINAGGQTIPLLQVGDFLNAEADVSVTKTDAPDPVTAGDQLTYTLEVTNLSTDTVANGVVVTDTLSSDTVFVSATGADYTVSGNTITFDIGSLAPDVPGQTNSVTLYITVIVKSTAPETITNTVSVSSVTGDEDLSNNSDTETTTVLPLTTETPQLTLSKSGVLDKTVEDPDDQANPGDIINYTLTATNTGNVTLTNVTVTDPLLGTLIAGTWPGPAGELEPGESITFTGSYTLLQSDIAAGKVENTATADSTQTDPVQTPASVTVPQVALLSVVKSGTLDLGTDGVARPDDLIHYTFTVTNRGNIALTNVTVTDETVIIAGGPITLQPGASDTTTFTGTYAITQADIDAGQFVNFAIASSDESPSVQDEETVTIPQVAGIELQKSGVLDLGPDYIAGVGDIITYHFTVKNTGNVTLLGVTVTDPKVTVNGGPTTLAPGEIDSTTFTGVYALTKADLKACSVKNTATVTGMPPSGVEVYDTDCETVILPRQSIIAFKFKDCDGDGCWDGNEPAIKNWTIKLFNKANRCIATQQTDASGKVQFSVAPGIYTVKEVMQDGWINTRAQQYTIKVEGGRSRLVYFANRPVVKQKICAEVFQDCDRDRKRDCNESGLANWTVQLFDCEKHLIATAQTDCAGRVEFWVYPGTYTMKVVLPPCWKSTTACQYTVKVVAGKTPATVNFGANKK